MVGFGGKQAWLAVRDADPTVVLTALGLRDLGPVPWRDGLDLAHFTDDRVVLTPPLSGAGDADWVLVAGRWLLRPGTAVDLPELSGRLGTEVQFFATHRVTELHRWQRAVDGVLVRAFGYVGQLGEVTTWHGEPQGVEVEIGLSPVLAPDTDVLVSESDVLRVARSWSLDPTSLAGLPAPGALRAAAVS